MLKRVAQHLTTGLLAAFVGFSVAAQQPSPDRTRCVNEGNLFSPDERISGCTAVLLTDRETPYNRAVVYHNRGIAYFAKKDYDRAIADYSEAIRLNPSANAYGNRGNAHYHKEDYYYAIADYGEAIKLDPSDAKAHYNRGLAYMVLARREEAIADFRRAQAI